MALDKERGRAWHYIPGFGSLVDFISELARLEVIQDRYDIEDRRDVKDFEQANSWESIRRNVRDWDTLGQAAGISSHNTDTPARLSRL
ncbi:hypothetical protein GGR58DRAFT_506877 [Xylaria digitata]|nr:hypothetical protein GGR58DRAFT_506877 [Xylaria digitata]